MQTVTDARVFQVVTVGYDPIMLRLHNSQKRACKGVCRLWLLDLDGSQFVPLCTDKPFRTGLLTVLVANRKGWVERKGRMLEIEAFDSDLAAELLATVHRVPRSGAAALGADW